MVAVVGAAIVSVAVIVTRSGVGSLLLSITSGGGVLLVNADEILPLRLTGDGLRSVVHLLSLKT